MSTNEVIKGAFALIQVVVAIVAQVMIGRFTDANSQDKDFTKHIGIITSLGFVMATAFCIILYLHVIEQAAGSQVHIQVAINGLLLWLVLFAASSASIQIINA